MAVYTHITPEEASIFLQQYDLGTLEALEPIAEGVENSNFLLRTTRGKSILTVFEKRIRAEDLPFCFDLMAYLQARGIPSPQPIADTGGNVINTLRGKPATIVSFLEGGPHMQPNAEDCRQLGEMLGRWHRVAQEFPAQLANGIGPESWPAIFAKFRERADTIEPGLEAQIAEMLERVERHWPHALPKGAVHADVFPDNVFFIEGRLSGVIDFYFSCTELLAYDLAIAMNAWCFDAAHRWLPENGEAMLAGYQQHRPLLVGEAAALPLLCQAAALRFLLSRAHDWLFHPEGSLVTPKDPREYILKLKHFQSI